MSTLGDVREKIREQVNAMTTEADEFNRIKIAQDVHELVNLLVEGMNRVAHRYKDQAEAAAGKVAT